MNQCFTHIKSYALSVFCFLVFGCFLGVSELNADVRSASALDNGKTERHDEYESTPVTWEQIVENYQQFREDSWPLVVPACEEEYFGSWDFILANIGKRIINGWFWYFSWADTRLEKGALPDRKKPQPVDVVIYEDIYTSRIIVLGMNEDGTAQELYSEKVPSIIASIQSGYSPEAELSMRRMAFHFAALPYNYEAPREEIEFVQIMADDFTPMLMRMGEEFPTNKIWLEIERDVVNPVDYASLIIHAPTDAVSSLDVFYHTNLLSVDPWVLLVDAENINEDGILAYTNTITDVSNRFYLAANADADSDSDGLTDGRERWLFQTGPTTFDTDGDGFGDGAEIDFGTDPLDGLNYFGVVINAIQPYPPPPGVENYREWVELFNSGRQAVSLGGFRLETARTTGWTNVFTFPTNTTLDSGDFLVVGYGSNGNFAADLLLPNSTYTPPSVFGLRLLPPSAPRVADAIFYGYTNDFDFSLEGFGDELPIIRPAQGGVIRRTWIGFDTDHAGDWMQVEGALWPPHLQGEHLDLDGDGLSNAEELENGVFPLDGGTQLTGTDSDGDGLSDFDEVNYEWNQVPAPLNPSDIDTDGDAFPWSLLPLPEGNDANEITNGSNPSVYDSDDDGIPDGWEIAGGLNPNSPDSDNDSDSDGDEDTDEDGIPNRIEVAQLSNPFDPDSSTPNYYLMLYNGVAFGCRNEGDIGYGRIITYDVLATSNCPPFLVEIREGGGQAEAYSVVCGAGCNLLREYEESTTGQTERVRVYAVDPFGLTSFSFTIIDGLTTWEDENPASYGADIAICHGSVSNDLERPLLPEVDDESVGFNIADKSSHPDAERKQLVVHRPIEPFNAISNVVLTYDTSKLLLYDTATGGNVIPSGSLLPVESLSTNVYAEGINASGAMRDAWVQSTPEGVSLPDRITATVLKAELGDPGILPYRPWHTNSARNILQLMRTLPSEWDGLMELNITGADGYVALTGGTPLAMPQTYTNQLLSDDVFLESSTASGNGLATFHVIGLADCIARKDLQILGVNATLDGVAETNEETIGGFIADRTAHTNASRTQLTLEAITPTNPPGTCTLSWNPQYLSLFKSPTGTNEIHLNGYDNVFHYSPFTNQTFYVEGITSGVTAISFSSAGLSDVINVTVIRVELEIYKPKVVDLSEAMIPNEGEMTTGSVTFVNFDNDDEDSQFDYGGATTNDDVVAGGDDELVKLKIRVQPNTLPVGQIQLSAPLGAVNVAVWTNNEKTTASSFTLGTTLSIPGDLEVDGDSLVKTVWVEGVLAHTAQRETTLKAEYTLNSLICNDEVALTVVGVDEVNWQGQNNSLNDDNTLDADPNWPSGLMPNSLRVFPDARCVSNVVEADPRDKVTAELKLTVEPPSEIKLYLKSFDVDDPTADVAPVDDEASAVDNRGLTPTQAGQFTGESGGVLELTFSANIQSNTCEFQTTMQPGDNFRIVANGDKDFLLKLENNDLIQNVGADAAETNANKQRICNQNVTNTPEEREIRLAANYASDVLTVWRFLHVEVDSMSAPPTNGVEQNTVEGNLTAISGNGTVAQRVSLDINLCTGLTPQDDSDNLDGTGNGRFENGWIQVGSTQTSGLLGNGNTYVRKDGGIDIPALVSKGGQPDISGSIVEWSGSTFTLNVTSGSLSTNYNGGTLNVAGASATISTVSTNSGVNTVNVTAVPTITFVLHDDDEASLPHSPDFGLMEDKFRLAFILPLADGGTALSNNKNTITYARNVDHTTHAALDVEFNKYGAFESESSRTNRFWLAYILGAFQAGVVKDYDPDLQSEWGPHGVNGGGSSYNRGALYFHESTRDYCFQQGLTTAHSLELERRFVVHEIGHQFDLNDNTGGIYDYSVIYDPSQNPQFTDVHLDSIRSREKSPGK